MESNANDCDPPKNETNDVGGENEIANGNIEEEKPEVADKKGDIPNLNLLHDDVRKCIELYVQQEGYSEVAINVGIGSNLGDNFMGFIGKLTITCIDQNNEEQTFNWIAKSAPDIEIHRKFMNISVIYGREAYVYSDVFKIFDDFQSEKRILELFDERPEFILSYQENMHESIVMKDVKSLGYIMRPREEPLDLNHVKLVMKAYAKLHATSYALKDQKPDVFKVIVDNTEDIMYRTLLTEIAIESQTPMIANALTALDSTRDPKIYAIFKKFLDNYGDIVTKLLLDTNDRSVIGHGDSWVNNMLWKYDVPESNVPTKVCLLDWQLARYGSPACDLSYFIFTCTTKDFRDQHYDNMIKLYYYTLCAHVSELGTDPQNFLTFEALQGELKKYSLIGLFTTVLVLSIMTKDTSEIPEWRSDDKNLAEMNEQWNKPGRNVEIYRRRVRDVVADFSEKGYFNNII